MVSEYLKQSVLDSHSSWGSTLPRLWVIEILACSNQADVSLLLDLVKKTPEIFEVIGKNAREWVSLRILESLYDQGARENSVSFPPITKIGFDPSEQCEDVLRRILPETSRSDLKTAGLEMLKWDFQPFIVHKRSTLAKCSLQKLKEAILVGSHPLSASLKEQSGLLGGNISEDEVPVNESNHNDSTPKLDGSDTNTQIGAASDKLISPTPVNGSNPFYKNMPDKNLLLSKRKRSVTTESNGGMQLTDTSMVPVQDSEGERCTMRKKSHVVGLGKNGSPMDDNNEHTSLKRLAGPAEVGPCVEQIHNFIPDDTSEMDCRDLDLRVNMLSRIVQNSERDVGWSGEKLLVGGAETNSPSRVGNNKQTSSKSVIGLDETLPSEKQADHRDTDMPNEAFDEEQEQDHAVEVAEGDKEGVPELKPSKKGMEPKQNIQRNVSETVDANIVYGGDVYHEDMTDIARRKNAFLQSHFTYSQDSSEKVDWKELRLCMKCNKGGKLLVCCCNSCSSVIHESCLGSDAIFDKMEEFRCPFCAYSLALSNYLEVKAKVSLARKDLATFLCGGSKNQSKGKFCRSYGMVQHHLEQYDDSHKIKKQTRDFGKKVNKLHSRKKIECEEAGPSVSSSGDDPPQEGVASASEMTKDLNKGKHGGKGMGQESHSPRVHGQNQMAAMANRISQGENIELISKKEVPCPPETDFLSESTYSLINESSNEDEISGGGSENSDPSKYFISVRKHESQSSDPESPQLRRKRVPWTIEEEQMLKDGMQIFCRDHDKIIQWKNILDYGENVFHKSRTTVDLKDKWRNVKKLISKLYPSDEVAQVP